MAQAQISRSGGVNRATVGAVMAFSVLHEGCGASAVGNSSSQECRVTIYSGPFNYGDGYFLRLDNFASSDTSDILNLSARVQGLNSNGTPPLTIGAITRVSLNCSSSSTGFCPIETIPLAPVGNSYFDNEAQLLAGNEYSYHFDSNVIRLSINSVLAEYSYDVTISNGPANAPNCSTPAVYACSPGQVLFDQTITQDRTTGNLLSISVPGSGMTLIDLDFLQNPPDQHPFEPLYMLSYTFSNIQGWQFDVTGRNGDSRLLIDVANQTVYQATFSDLNTSDSPSAPVHPSVVSGRLMIRSCSD